MTFICKFIAALHGCLVLSQWGPSNKDILCVVMDVKIKRERENTPLSDILRVV